MRRQGEIGEKLKSIKDLKRLSLTNQGKQSRFCGVDVVAKFGDFRAELIGF
jgi:hypothetical protein